MSMLSKEKAYLIFRIAWIYFLISNIADLRLHTDIDLIPFIHISEIPFIKFLPVVIAFFIVVPVKQVRKLFDEKFSVKVITVLALFLVTALVSSFFSLYEETAFKQTARWFFYFIVLIILLITNSYFSGHGSFIIRSFIYVNILVIAGSLLDYYSPEFNSLLIKHFDRPAVEHSVLKIGDKVFMRPMGFLTDSNLTAFSIGLALILLLLNYRSFSKYFTFIFFASGSFVFGMLASRASLIMCLAAMAYFFISGRAEKKIVVLYFAVFIIFQALTPQTYSRFISVNEGKTKEEFNIGRVMIWKAAFELFRQNPVIGAGPGNFFEYSRELIRSEIFANDPNSGIDDPVSEDYHVVGKGNPHNIFLAVLSETGIAGFLLMLLFIFAVLYKLFRVRKYNSVLFFLLILFVSSLSNFAPYYRFYLLTCIIFYIASFRDMLLKPDTNGNVIRNENVKKILIFKLCCFGDTVFMTPAILSLKNKFPQAEIYYAYDKWVGSMMKYIPELNGSILFENVYSKNIFQKVKGVLKFIINVRKTKFDLVLNGHRSSQLSFILFLCGIRYRLGFSDTKFLTHTAEFNGSIQEFLRYQQILKENGIEPVLDVPVLKRPSKQAVRAQHNIKAGDFVIGVFPIAGNNPGTHMDIKRWDLNNYFGLISGLNVTMPEARILIFEGRTEDEKFELPANIKADKFSIDNDLLSCCDIFISSDTGSLHIAAAFGVSTVSVFGPSDPRLLAPVSSGDDKHIYIWKRLSCSPCYDTNTSIDRNNHKFWNGNNFICHLGTQECIKSVSIEEVHDAVMKIAGLVRASSG